MFKVPEGWRVTKGPYGTSETDGNNGAFRVQLAKDLTALVIASDGLLWEHVSVSIYGEDRTPTWAEMCFVKSLFWDDGDCVMQLHPPSNEYINNHSFCLHLWRPTHVDIPMPPSIMVGVKEFGLLV